MGQSFVIYRVLSGLYHLHRSLTSLLVYKDKVFSAEGMKEWIDIEVLK